MNKKDRVLVTVSGDKKQRKILIEIEDIIMVKYEMYDTDDKGAICRT